MKKNKQEKHPIISHGEVYIEAVNNRKNFGDKKYPHEYKDAKVKIVADLEKIEKTILQGNEVFMEDKVLCVRLEEDSEGYILEYIEGKVYEDIL